MAVHRLAVGAVAVTAAVSPALPRVRTAAHPRHDQSANVRWHGGPVQRHPRVYVIFWGPKWSTSAPRQAVRTMVVRTIRALRGSSYQQLLTQYYDRAGHVTGDVRLAGVWHDRTIPREDFTANHRGVHDAAEEIAHTVAVRRWHNSGDAQYLLLLQSPERNGYCALNADRSLGGQMFIFTIVPWLGPRGYGCGIPLGRAYSSTLSHEYAEMVTDPLANAWARGNPAGHNHEIADLCNTQAKVRGVWMEKIWSNRLNRCAA